MEIIKSLLLESDENLAFTFISSSENQTSILRNATENIPNSSGLYLVFCEKNSQEVPAHLLYSIKNKEYILCYFGKAGGTTKKGKITSQGLNGRINNVVSDSNLNQKDIKRAKYWNLIMQRNNINHFLVQCFLLDEPQEIEDKIYQELDLNKLDYPLMNKKRGPHKY